MLATRVSRADGFGRSSRFYDVEGRHLVSVTTVLQAAPAKPALVGWAAKTERELVLRTATDLYEDLPAVKMSRLAYRTTLENRLGKEKAHTKELTKASDIGSQAHAWIEWSIRRELQQKVGSEPSRSDKALWATMAYEDWRKSVNLVPLQVEQAVYSLRYGYAGTMDWLGEIDHEGQRLQVLGDFKTSKGIWPEMYLQVAAYIHALVEMGHATFPLAGCIVRLPKVETDPEFEVQVIPAERIRRLHKVFLSCLDIWNWQEEEKA